MRFIAQIGLRHISVPWIGFIVCQVRQLNIKRSRIVWFVATRHIFKKNPNSFRNFHHPSLPHSTIYKEMSFLKLNFMFCLSNGKEQIFATNSVFHSFYAVVRLSTCFAQRKKKCHLFKSLQIRRNLLELYSKRRLKQKYCLFWNMLWNVFNDITWNTWTNIKCRNWVRSDLLGC